MRNRIIGILFFVLTSTYGYSLSISFEGGISYFEYAEVSTNNKDDLFKLKSVTGGISIGSGKVKNFIGVQVPYQLQFEDALGSDDKNYIYDFVYFGFNDKLLYSVWDGDHHDLNFLISVNYFMLRDHYDIEDTDYDFLTIGPGLGLDLEFNLWDSLKLYIKGETSMNFPLYFRWEKDFLWSYSTYINAGFLYQF